MTDTAPRVAASATTSDATDLDARVADATADATAVDATPHRSLADWLRSEDEPFDGARDLVGEGAEVVVTGRMGAPASSFDVYAALRRREAGEISLPLVAVFAGPVPRTDDGLEDLLWETLQHLSDFDEVPWSAGVASALDSDDHVVVVAGEAWTVDALHPHATERSRRAPWPALVIRPASPSHAAR